MSEVFDSIALEVEFSAGVWTNISSDVVIDPPPHWNRGVMQNGIMNRVGEPEILTFGLKNGPTASNGIGTYSPGHANMRTGWRTGLNVRLSFTYDGRVLPYYKYYGTIKPDGIDVKPGIYGPRTVGITCHGYMGRAANHDLNLVDLAENKTITQAVALIIANMTTSPLTTDYGIGVSVFPTVFDTVTPETKAIAEFEKLAISEPGYIYTVGNRTNGETLVVKGRNDLANLPNTPIPLNRADSGKLLLQGGGYLLLQGGGKLILNQTTTATFDNTMLAEYGAETAYGKHLANRIKTNAYPRRIDAAATTVLWSLERAIEIKAGETKTGIRGTYRDPSGVALNVRGKSMVAPVSGTDFVANSAEDGSGSNQTASMSVTADFGVADVEFTAITNSSGASIWTGGAAGTFQVRGKGIYFDNVATNVLNDTNSQVTNGNGVVELELDMKYQDSPALTDAFAQYILANTKDPYTTFERVPLLANRDTTNMNAFLTFEPGSRAAFDEDMNAIDNDYFIMGYDADLINGKYIIWYPVLVRHTEIENDFFLWDFMEDFASTGADPENMDMNAIAGGGAQSYGTPITGHSGVWIVLSHVSNANSGASFTGADAIPIQAGMQMRFIFDVLHANTSLSFGISDSLTSPTNGLWYSMSSGSLTGKATSASSTSTTGTSYTISTATWYRAEILVGKNAETVTYYLYNDSDTLLWSDTLTTNIPPSSASAFPLIRCIHSGSPGGQQNLAYCDYFGERYSPALAR